MNTRLVDGLAAPVVLYPHAPLFLLNLCADFARVTLKSEICLMIDAGLTVVALIDLKL